MLEAILYCYMAAKWFMNGETITAALACMVSVAEVVGLIKIVR